MDLPLNAVDRIFQYRSAVRWRERYNAGRTINRNIVLLYRRRRRREAIRAAAAALRRLRTLRVPMEIAEMLDRSTRRRPSPQDVAILRVRLRPRRYGPGSTNRPYEDVNLWLKVRWGIEIPRRRIHIRI